MSYRAVARNGLACASPSKRSPPCHLPRRFADGCSWRRRPTGGPRISAPNPAGERRRPRLEPRPSGIAGIALLRLIGLAVTHAGLRRGRKRTPLNRRHFLSGIAAARPDDRVLPAERRLVARLVDLLCHVVPPSRALSGIAHASRTRGYGTYRTRR